MLPVLFTAALAVAKAGTVVWPATMWLGLLSGFVMRCCCTLLLLVFIAAPLPEAAAEQTGSVAGTIVFEGEVAAPLTAQYRTRTRFPIAEPDSPRAIVYLERDDGVYPQASDNAVVSVDQQGYQFRPAMVAVRRGTQVRFPNRDNEFHSVFSYSPVKRFDLGRFRRDEDSPLVTFDQAGLVKVYCEIHKHMRGLVLVLETPWFTTTDDEGRYLLDGVPAGDYRLSAFLPSEKILDARVSVAGGRTSHVDLGAGR